VYYKWRFLNSSVSSQRFRRLQKEHMDMFRTVRAAESEDCQLRNHRMHLETSRRCRWECSIYLYEIISQGWLVGVMLGPRLENGFETWHHSDH